MIDNNFKNIELLSDIFIYHPDTKTIDRIKIFMGRAICLKKYQLLILLFFNFYIV